MIQLLFIALCVLHGNALILRREKIPVTSIIPSNVPSMVKPQLEKAENLKKNYISGKDLVTLTKPSCQSTLEAFKQKKEPHYNEQAGSCNPIRPGLMAQCDSQIPGFIQQVHDICKTTMEDKSGFHSVADRYLPDKTLENVAGEYAKTKHGELVEVNTTTVDPKHKRQPIPGTETEVLPPNANAEARQAALQPRSLGCSPPPCKKETVSQNYPTSTGPVTG